MCSSIMGSHGSEGRSVGTGNPLPSADARPGGGQSPVPFRIPPRRENGSLPRNVCSTGSGPELMLSSAGGTSNR